MPILQNGSFTFEIPTEDLAKGLRPSARSPRNAKFLTTCEGMVGLDNVLQVLDDIETHRVLTAAITDDFPYPQLFVFTNAIIICGETTIYELIAGALTLVLDVGVGNAGIEWSAVDFFDYIYMSNGKVAIQRRATDQLWEITSDVPIASAICNFNGQVLIGAPDVVRP